MQGKLCSVGVSPNQKRLFFYDVSQGLHIEIIDRRERELRHLVRLVDAEGNPVKIPAGSHFVELASEHCVNLLDQYLRPHEAVPA